MHPRVLYLSGEADKCVCTVLVYSAHQYLDMTAIFLNKKKKDMQHKPVRVQELGSIAPLKI